jgi:hypothetical protein
MLNPIIPTIPNILNIQINRINLNSNSNNSNQELMWMICFIRRPGWMMLMMRMMGMVSLFSLFFLFRVVELESRGVSLALVVSSHSSLREGATLQRAVRLFQRKENLCPPCPVRVHSHPRFARVPHSQSHPARTPSNLKSHSRSAQVSSPRSSRSARAAC